MIKINRKDNYFDYIDKNPDHKVVIYGIGENAKNNYMNLGKIDYFCDKKAKDINELDGIPCIIPEQLKSISSQLIIMITVKNENVVSEICSELSDLDIDAEVFIFFDNPAFQWFDCVNEPYDVVSRERLKIRIVYRDDGWIFGKFANNLMNELTKLGQEVSVSSYPDKNADVNHYVAYAGLSHFFDNSQSVNTTMITHIDSVYKKELIKFQAEHDALGICMSNDTLDKLTLWGIPREKLCYINPAQDGLIKPRKIILGITNRCYGSLDLRKRDNLIYEVCKKLDPDFFELRIMGAGWSEIVSCIRGMGFEVTYYEDFYRDIYIRLMPSLDYWLYYGFDEGAMGYLDAMAAGVKTIVTPQGYHLDTNVQPTFFCSTIDEFVSVLLSIEKEKRAIVESVSEWTWENYAKKHLEIWQYLTKSKPLKELYQHQSEYRDGIFSVLLKNNSIS